ncbi:MULTISPECIES: FAD-dependent monooxygenase [Methylorubrum]|uniref:FAD-dependent monooxygenase n=1 Tax=Methylorubrum TaxID=2282523 RepID=UPI00209D4DD2|nr:MULTISPECIES: FAD-dependent monooxygenase [Methylorubrum]MCP1551253.1 2-polyprenyl-6-methoxyphenol hydroxylase-like FAD-dependent oxidoreductase [Methylorubrum zatmanii]MCP1552131.1 2-polyprenyl-6-methoxyphenol hydroxylase-like FAD-dependent oxidoreductase [Methylorubrum extorquens]MCP1581558.1 2-polyprenyl-6-methoxyphenol hydroxylase-like FAD-dependent oxidoreductase [Methylorubrum extorquens]
MDTQQAGRVLVAGGGIAGLAVRRALHQRGIPSLTLERRGEQADAGLAINLPGNAVRALSQFGLLDLLRAVGAPVRRREYRTERGRLLFAVDETAFWGTEAGPHCLRRADLLRLLQDDLAPDDIRRGIAIATVRQDPQGVTAELADGSTEKGGLLVGADGVHSAVRRSLFGEQALGAAMLASQSWRFMTPNPGVEAWTLWAGAGALFLLIPVDRGEAYGWASVSAGRERGSDPAAIRGAFAPFPRVVRDTLDAVLSRADAVYHSPLEEVRIPTWTRDRVVLLGDAAHATAPVWAQGAALALEDAQVLARLLAERTDWNHVGPDFERLRRPRVAHVQSMTDRLSRTARLPDWARNVLLPVIGPRSYHATYGPLRTPTG